MNVAANNTHAAAGASQAKEWAGSGLAAFVPDHSRSSFADGRRGTQDFNCASNDFISFITFSSHTGS